MLMLLLFFSVYIISYNIGIFVGKRKREKKNKKEMSRKEFDDNLDKLARKIAKMKKV